MGSSRVARGGRRGGVSGGGGVAAGWRRRLNRRSRVHPRESGTVSSAGESVRTDSFFSTLPVPPAPAAGRVVDGTFNLSSRPAVVAVSPRLRTRRMFRRAGTREAERNGERTRGTRSLNGEVPRARERLCVHKTRRIALSRRASRCLAAS